MEFDDPIGVGVNTSMRARLLLRERRVLTGRGKETRGKAAQIPPNPQLPAAGGTLHRADTIEVVAEAAGLPPENLTATEADILQ